ncbi:hypothetical protein [Streptomyces sp. NPDC047841]|uniref:hypothetical protein n=1 Tax=Streptomyces sp. NPDC047841 TaxID=3154708 RepID=UPI0034560CCD
MSETTRDGRGPVRIPAPAGVFPAARCTRVLTAAGRLVAVPGRPALDAAVAG